MSKYNLSDLVKEYIGGGRIGTLNISFRDLLNKMDDLEKSGKVIVRTLSGPSGDGKVNREFEVVALNDAIPGGNKQEKGFTVYDYKFGFDPGDEEHFDQEYDFSVGGTNLALAQNLGLDVKPYGIKINEGDLFSSKFDRQELKAIINDLNEQPIFDMAVRRAYKFLVSLLDKEDKEEMGLDEQMYIDDDEFNKEMGRSKKDALRQEMMFHVNQLMDGNIDKNDFMNVVEDIMMDLGLKEVMGVDRKGRKKPESKSNMTKVNEASQEESVATYIQDYYRNPKTGESMISDEMVDEFYKTHPEWEDQADGTKEGMKAVLDNFNEFFEINYGIMFDDSRDIDENLKKHFKRFM